MTGFKSYLDQVLQRPVHWLLRKKLRYWHQGGLGFAKQGQGWIFQPNEQKSGILVLSREHYQEFVRSYPITVLSELNSVLTQEYIAQPLVFHAIAEVDNNRRQVCTFVVDQTLAPELSGCWLVIPETWLLWLSSPKSQMLFVSSPTKYFCYSGDKVPISQRVSVLCQSADAFKVVQGIPAQTSVVEVSQHALADKLARAMSLALVHPGLRNFLRLPSGENKAQVLKQALMVTALASVLYLVGSSLYLNLRISSTEYRLSQLSSDVGDLLIAQQRYEQIAQDYEKYLTERLGWHYSGHIWLVLAQAQQKDKDLELTSIVMDGENLIVRGQTARATDLLAMLKANADVQSASFVAPVVNAQGKESFVVAIRLVDLKIKQGQVDGSQ